MKNKSKRKLALILSLLMTAYAAEVPAFADGKSSINAEESKDTEKETNGSSESETYTADIYVENVTCAGGDLVKVSIGLVDWAQDIDNADINIEFDSSLSLVAADPFGSVKTTVNDNQVSVSGKLDKKEAYRGRLAVLTFSIPEVEDLTVYKVKIASAVLKDSSGKECSANYSYGTITADSSLKPTDLSFSEISSGSVKFSWNMIKNADKTKGYIVFRNGEEIARTEEKEYFDSGLESGNEYIYSVQAYGSDNYMSPVSAEIRAVPEVSEVKAITFNKTAGHVGGNEAVFKISMNKDTHVKNISIYSLDDSDKRSLICSEEESVFAVQEYKWDISSLQSGKYRIAVKITDIDGAEITAVSDEVMIDKGAPDPVEQFNAFSDEECVRLSWGRGNQLNISGYNIYRKTEDSDYVLIKFAEGIDNLSYTDTTAENGVVYYYNITAVNCFEQEGEMTEAVSASSKSDQTPPVITAFMPEKGKTLTGTVKITARASDNDGVGVSKIVFSVSDDDGATWSTVSETEGDYAELDLDTTVYETQSIQVKVNAEDKKGNVSNDTVNKYSIDNKAPEKVTGIDLVEVYDTYATLSWKDVADNDRQYFIVEYTDQKTGEKRNCTVRSELGVHLNSLTPSTQYNVVVYAADNNGNISEASDVFELVTKSDSHSPHIIAVDPAPGSFRDSIPLKVTADDNIGISMIKIEVSSDGENFDQVAEAENTEGGTRFTAQHELDLSGFEDGMIYVKFTAYDTDGLSGFQIAEYLVDTVKPEKVKNVECNTIENQIEIKWDDYEDERISCYKIFRKTEDSEEYELIKVNDSSNRYSNYFDRNIEPGKTYSYKVSAVDEAGNESDLSDECTGTVESDIKNPEIYNVYPESGLSLNSRNNYVRVWAHDNICLSKIVIEYYCGDKEKEYELLAEKETDTYDDDLQVQFPEELLVTGNVIHIRAYSVDKADNKSEYSYAEYTVDNTVTTVTNCIVNSDNGTVTVTWEADESDTTAGYEVYKRIGDGDYRYVGRVYYDAMCGGKYTYTETDIEDAGTSWYRIVSYNTNFNKTIFDCKDAVEVYLTPNAVIGCEDAMERNKEYIFDASGTNDVYGISTIVIDYGDGTTETCSLPSEAIFKHRYSYNGSYNVKLTAVNTMGLSSVAERLVEVSEGVMIGNVNITVKTTEGKPASNIAVYCDVGTPYQTKRYTNANGNVSFQTTAGIHAIGVYGDGYLPDIRNCSVMSGAQNNYTFSVVEEDIISAKFDVQRMTFDEIKAVGIDINDKENQHVLKLDVRLTYGAQPVNLGGYFIGGGVGCGVFLWAGEPPKCSVKGNDGIKRKIQPVSVSVDPNGEVNQLIILDLPVEASYLKEFFDVKLHIINNASSEFSVVDNVVTLNVPDGLKLIENNGYDGIETVIDEIQGGTQKTVQWILRGDESGTYKINADYQGVLQQFNEELNFNFESDEITVYGEKAAQVDVFAEKLIEENEMYVKVSVSNTSPVDIYNAGALIHDASAVTFGSLNDKFQCDYILSEIISESGITEYSLDESVDVLPAGFVFSVIYHLTHISEDMLNPVTLTMVNFYENVAHHLDTQLTNLNDSGIKYDVKIVDAVHNCFDHSNDSKNFELLSTDNAELLNDLTDRDNILSAKVAKKIRMWQPVTGAAENKDDAIDFLLNPGLDDIKDKDKYAYVDEVISSLLVSDEVSGEIEKRFENNLVVFLSGLLDKSILTLKIPKEYNKDKKFLENVYTILVEDKTSLYQALNELNTGGIDAFTRYVEAQLNANFSAEYADLNAWVSKSVGDAFKMNFFDVVNFADTMNKSFKEQWKNYLGMLMYRSVYEESVRLLTTLSKKDIIYYADGYAAIVGNRASELLEKLDDSVIQDAFNAASNVYCAAAEAVVMRICSKGISNAVKAAAGPIGAAVYSVIGFGYGFIRQDIDNKYFYPAKIALVDVMCDRITEDLEKFIDEGSVTDSMVYVEYLTKLRARQSSDCKTFKYNVEEGGVKVEYITTPGLGLLYSDIVSDIDADAMSEYIAQIQRNADVLFRPDTEEVLHEWPEELKYNYAEQKLEGSLDVSKYNYKYRIDEDPWNTYTEDTVISADENSHILTLRCEDTAKDAVRTVRIKASEFLEGDLSVRYAGGYYTFDSNLSGTGFKLVFSDEKEIDESEWRNAVNWSGGSVILYKKYKYVHIRKTAADDEPASLSRTVAVVSTVSVDAGCTSGGTVKGAGEYDIGDIVTLTAAPSKGYVFAGWYSGDNIISQNEEYSFRAYRDISLTARFLSEKDYTVRLSSNVESAVNQSVSIDGSGMIYVITSECSDENYRFSYWEDENGKIVSFLQSFPFVVDGETALRAVYEKISE